MTKWVALALGVLLALGGAVSMWNGVDVIQSERGWASVIAGAVTLAGGVITFALFLVIRELQGLRASLAMVMEGEPAPASHQAEAPAEAVPAPVLHADAHPVMAPPVMAPPVMAPHAPAHEPEPAAPRLEPHAPEHVAEPAPQPAPEPAPQESFDQAFPPVPVEPTPTPPARERFRFRASDAAVGIAAGAAAIGMFGRSRVSESAPAAPQEAEPHPVEEAPAPEPEPHHEEPAAPVDALDVSEAEIQEAAAALRGGAPEVHEEQQPVEAAHEEPVAEAAAQEPTEEAQAEEPPHAEVDESQVSPGYAWLERALAREEGGKSPALDWLRSRPPTSLLIDPAAQAEEPAAEEPAAEEAPAVEELAGEEPAAEAQQAAEQEAAEPEAAEPTAQEEAPQEAEPAPEPGVIGRYSSGGSDYTLYSDGSIDAQTEQGLFRFESMAELRAYIEAQNKEA